jgi:cytochrome P450
MAMTADQSVDFELSRFAEIGNELLQKLDAIREQDPIYWSETNQAWLITGHKQIVESFSGRLPLSNTRIPHSATGLIPEAEREKRFPYLYRTARYWLPNMDPPAHTRQRKLMMKAFSRSVVEGIRPHARRFIQEALDAAGARNRVEYVTEVCRKIPARTILRQFGIDDASVPRLHRWSIAINTLGNINTPPELLDECERTLLEMRELFMIEIEKRRVRPGDDFISALVTASEDADELTDEEILGACYVTLIAGHDTTANTLALSTLALAQHAEARQFLREHPEKTGDAIMELMRYVSMSTTLAKVAIESFAWHGHAIKKGQVLFIFQGAGNRDPKVFAGPEKLNLNRPQTPNLTFAPGLHHCIGHLLAKMQVGEFLPELVRRFEVEILDEQLSWAPALGFRGLNTLHLRLHPRNQH